MNPYDLKLMSYSKVLRNEEGSVFKGKWSHYFKNKFPLTLEIGTGFGGFALEYLKQFSQENFIGLDYRFKRSLQLIKKLEKNHLSQYVFLRTGAHSLPLFFEEEINKVFLLFSDPWPKKRHHKKRLVQKNFIELIAPLLKKGAKVFIKTDNEEYFNFMLQEDFPSFDSLFMSKNLHQEEHSFEELKLLTDFEKIFLAQKIPIKALVLEKK